VGSGYNICLNGRYVGLKSVIFTAWQVSCTFVVEVVAVMVSVLQCF
jgi:hypothetical protein